MAPPRIVVIVNPKAQNGALGARWADIGASIRRELGSFDDVRTASPGDATRLAREAIDGGADVVVAIGGDGTINEVTNGFFDGDEPIGNGASLAVIPFGTGGDFRKTLHIPKDVARAARIIAEGKTRVIDVGHVELVDHSGAPASRVFANIASFGMSGLVVKYANESSKRFGGRITFMLATARASFKYDNQRVRMVFDGDPESAVETTISTVAVSNGRFFGGGMKIAPEAELDDGKFDVVALGDLGLTDFILNSRRIYAGTHLSLEKVSCRRARTVTAEALGSEIIQMDVDGEQPGRLPATFRVLPRALSLVVP